jgi:arylsulfatase A-like enzyme
MKFTDFHANGPVCSPTRCALLTGRYQQSAGIDGLVRVGGLKKSEITFADALQPSGYTSAVFGKWHLGSIPESNPVNQGFAEFRGLLGGRFDYFDHTNGGQPDWWDGLKPLLEKGYSTTLITEHAVDFIRRSKSKPFCLYVAYNAVHTPIQDPETGEHGKTADVFGKMTQAMDKGIGRIIATLKEHGLAENTFVFFFSDNGGHEGIAGSSNKPLRGFMGSLWEGGQREPAIAWWPGHIPAGKVTGQTAMSMDLMPTMLELAGATLPPDRKLDGVSLVPLLLHGQPLAPRKLFWKKGHDFAMRDGPWKLLIENGTPHLFNLDNDLSEQNDWAGQQPERVKTMRAEIDAWAKDVGAERGEGSRAKSDEGKAAKGKAKPAVEE